MVVGTGKHTFSVVEGWGQGPSDPPLAVIGGVAVDSQDRVYVANRFPRPSILVYDREGRFLDSWGMDIYPVPDDHWGGPHGIWIGPDDRVVVTDNNEHTVRIFTTDGKLLQTLGTPRQRGAPGEPFNKPANAMVAPWGDIFVADGYGQNRVHRFAPDGTLLRSWGEKGTGPGQFDLVHGVWAYAPDRIFVADRQNHRIQIFDLDGRFIDQWTGFVLPMMVYVDRNDTLYIPEGTHRVTIMSLDGKLLARWGEPGPAAGQFFEGGSPHAAWVDSHGDLYISEVAEPRRLQKFARL